MSGSSLSIVFFYAKFLNKEIPGLTDVLLYYYYLRRNVYDAEAVYGLCIKGISFFS